MFWLFDFLAIFAPDFSVSWRAKVTLDLGVIFVEILGKVAWFFTKRCALKLKISPEFLHFSGKTLQAWFCSYSILTRKGSEDLSASDYYLIYQRTKKDSKTNNKVISSNEDEDCDQEDSAEISMEKTSGCSTLAGSAAGVKVQGGGIAER